MCSGASCDVAAVVVVVWPEHETSVFKPTACLVVRARSVDFRLFFYLPHGRGIRVYESCRAHGIANIRLIISPLIVCSSVPSPGLLILFIFIFICSFLYTTLLLQSLFVAYLL
jgi:hypothetical protein